MSRADRGESRRRFLGQLGAAVGAITIGGPGRRVAMAMTGEATSPTGVPARPAGAAVDSAAQDGAPAAWFPRQDPKLVEQVVGLAHRDLDGVRELVTRRPELAKAQWDWGYGDWESPLDAASHVGQREIALLLLQHGARPTIFSAAMLGQLDVVQAFVAAGPGIQATPGPHGIPLLAHARVGGAPAAAVVAYLEKVGGAGGPGPGVPLGGAELQRYLGTYRCGPGADDQLEVAPGRAGLTISRRGGVARGLVSLGDHAFHPVGAPSVRVRFEVSGERSRAVAIHDAELLVHGTRTA